MGRVGLPARPLSDPDPWVRAVRAGGRLPDLPGEQGSVRSAGLSWSRARLDPGLCLCCLFRLCCQASRGSFYRSCLIVVTGLLDWLSLLLRPRCGGTFLHNAIGFRSGWVGDRDLDMNESGRKVFYSPLRISGRNEVECIGLERGAGSATAPHCRETRFISPAVSLRPGFSLLSTVFVVVCLHWWEMLLSQNQAQGNRDLQQFLAFWDLRMGLRSVLCGLFQLQMAGWSQQLCCGKGNVLLTEAFITLAAGASGGGEVVLCGVGLVSLHLTGVVELSCG